MCEICGKGHDEDSILLCDACTGICLSVYLIISPSLHLHSSIYVCVSVCVCVCLCVCVCWSATRAQACVCQSI